MSGAIWGHSLSALLGDEPADSSVLNTLRGVLETVSFIHAAGASHPPLSPGTIRFGDRDQPQIQSSTNPREVADTVPFGSTKYSAPEAFVAAAGSASCEQIDCYVLGFMFYEILLGRQLFALQFASLDNGQPSAWLRWHADRNLKARPLSELRPTLGHFARLIDGMMEKDASKRIGSIPRALTQFANIDAHTVYRPRREERSANVRRGQRTDSRWRQKLSVIPALAASWLAKRRRSTVVLATCCLLLVAGLILALFLRRETGFGKVHRPMLAAKPVQQWPIRPTDGKSPSPLPENHAPASLVETSKTEMQLESHLRSRAVVLLDGFRRLDLPANASLAETITPGRHRIVLVTRSEASLSFPFRVSPDGNIRISKDPRGRSLNYAILAASGATAHLYALPRATASLPGQAWEPVPDAGEEIARDAVIAVRFNGESQSPVQLGPLSARSMTIVLEPSERHLLVPVEISANVPDAGIVINGVRLKRPLNRGARVIHLRAGRYRVKCVHSNYEASKEQNVIITGDEQRSQLHFILRPMTRTRL